MGGDAAVIPAAAHRCWVEIDHAALAHNVAALHRHLSPGTEILAIVKANAYGHGATEVAPSLARLGIEQFGVASLPEAMELRAVGLHNPILLLGGICPEQIGEVLDRQLVPVVYHWEMLRALADYPSAQPIPLTLKIDTGMGRLGFPFAEIDALAGFLAEHRYRLELRGLMSHAADADDPGGEAFTRDQFNRFHAALARIERVGLSPRFLHLSNSALALTGRLGGNLVRAGLLLYGYGPGGYPEPGRDLRPVMSFKTRILQIGSIADGAAVGYARAFTARRPSRIATVAAGYADGVPWRLSGSEACALVAGRRAPLVGRVSMDYAALDVTDIPEAREGRPVTWIGAEGGDRIGAADWARWAGTIPYEILCGISARVPRLHT